MSKEKPRIEEEKSEIYYEAIGVTIISLILIVLTKLGKVGLGLNMVFKIIFGDWSWLLLSAILFIGIRYVVLRKNLDIRSIKTNGFILLFLSLITISHSTMQSYAKNFNNNALVGLWNVYKQYIDNPLTNYMLGGGFVGGLLYMVFSYLIGEIATVILLTIFIVLAIIFLTGNSVFTFKDYLIRMYRKITKTKKGVLNYLENIKTPKKDRQGRIGINMLNDIKISMNFTVQKKISEDILSVLKNVFENKKIVAFHLENHTGYTASRYVYKADSIDINELKKSLLALNYTPIIYQNDCLIIELTNKFRELLTLKRILLKGSIPIGLEINDEIIEYDFKSNILISGSYDSGIRTFIKAFITTLLIRRVSFSFALIDPKEEFYELRNHSYLAYDYASKYETIDKVLDLVVLELEKRMEMFNYLNVKTLDEYNEKTEEKEKKVMIIINGYEMLKKHNPSIDQLLMYLATNGLNFGINIIMTNRISKIVGSMIKSSFQMKMLFKTSNIEQSLELLDNTNALYLEKRGDFILKKDTIIKRGQTGYISNEDYKKIIF